ncbi:hypothetical protein ES705_29902 [subsurface metagenome]
MTMDDELKKIKERKAKELMRIAQLRQEGMETLKKAEEAPKSVTEEDKLNVMNYFLTSEAYEYWKVLYDTQNKKETAETIFINVLYLVKVGYMEGRQISRLGIKKLERKIDNIPSTLTIKRKGEKNSIQKEL